MKAEELMIGDWVYGCTDPYDQDEEQKKYPVKVIKIDIDGDTWTIGNNPFTEPYEDEWWNLEPIPLTPEILEENTSESNKNIFGGMNYVLNADFFIENRGDRFCLSRRMAGHKYSTFWVCDIHYVHELQHALRLCGIDKEIVI